jgi:hypothetical protein
VATVNSALKDLKNYPKDAHIAYAIWQVDDVLEKAKEMEVTLTETEASEIIDFVHNKHDAELGISWMTIETAIDIYMDEHGKGKPDPAIYDKHDQASKLHPMYPAPESERLTAS